MNRIDINKNGIKIALFGSKSVIEFEKDIINNLSLTGNESKDRLIIQQCIDDNKLKSDILYDGNTVYPFEKIVKQCRKLQKDETLDNLNENMYHFFTNACGDIAHYNIGGFKAYYNNSFRSLEIELLSKDTFIPNWHTDLDKIFKELKIGKYFKNRENINISNISLSKLKSIIEECNWNVVSEGNDWKLQFPLDSNSKFSFNIDVSNSNATSVVYNLYKYGKEFNADEYIESIIESRGNAKEPSARLIVRNADYIAHNLSKLSLDLIYKCRLAAEKISKSNNDLEFEIER